MAKQPLKKCQNIRKKVFDSLITGDETWVYFYEPKRTVNNRIWVLERAKRFSITKQTPTAKVWNAIFFRNSGPLMQMAVPKGSGVSGSFYMNAALKTIANKNEKSTFKNRSPACPFLIWQCSRQQILNCTLRKHAYLNILKISPPTTQSFQIKSLIFFHVFAQNIDCGYSLEPPRQGGSNEYHNLCFWAEIRIIMYTRVNPSFTI